VNAHAGEVALVEQLVEDIGALDTLDENDDLRGEQGPLGH